MQGYESINLFWYGLFTRTVWMNQSSKINQTFKRFKWEKESLEWTDSIESTGVSYNRTIDRSNNK